VSMITLVLLQFHPDQTNISGADGTHPLLKWCPAYRSPAGPCLLGHHDLQCSHRHCAPLLQGATTTSDRWDNQL